MQDLINALEETLKFVQGSNESMLVSMPISELKTILIENITALKLNGSYQRRTLGGLFAPTGVIQETAMDNGWAEAYMRLSSVVDYYTDPNHN